MENSEKDKTRKRIEIAANVGIIIVALAIVVTLIRNYRGEQSRPHQNISAGTKLALKDANWKGNRRSVVLALSTTCHFCAESAGFYQKLAVAARQQHVHTVAVFPQAVPEAQAYLQRQGFAVDEIRQAELPSLDIRGTPTLLLVDEAGVVQAAWIGKLADETENEVLAKLTL